MPTSKNFNQLLIFVNLYQHAKNQAISPRTLSYLKILQSDLLMTFWPISQEPDFSRVWSLCRNIANNINFRYSTNLVNTNDQIFSINSENPIFGPFSQFCWQNNFLKNLALSRTTSHGFLVSHQNFEKTNDPIPRKRLDWQKDGQQLLFYRPFPATIRG